MIMRLAAIVFPGVIALLGANVAPAQMMGGYAAIVSDYVNRGLSESCGDPAAQADVHLQEGLPPANLQLFAGVWGSIATRRYDCGQPREINAYGGGRLPLGTSNSLGLIYTHYAYPGGGPAYFRETGQRFDYDELEMTWTFRDQLSADLAWTPDAVRYADGEARRDRRAWSGGVQYEQPLWKSLAVLAGAGYDCIADPSGAGFAFWNVGMVYRLRSIELQVQYFRTASRAAHLFPEYTAGGRAAASVLWAF